MGLEHHHMAAFSTSTPNRRVLNIISEVFPEEARETTHITTHREVHANANGGIVAGDVVAYYVDGQLHIGELLVNVGFVYASGNATMRSIASSWGVGKGMSDSGLNLAINDNVIKFDTRPQAFTYRMAEDGVFHTGAL